MLLASAIGFLGMVAGLYISYYAETPASASITIISVSYTHLDVYKRQRPSRYHDVLYDAV